MRYLFITFLILTLSNSCSTKYREETSESISFKFAIIELPEGDLQYIAEDYSNSWVPDTTDLIAVEQLIRQAVGTTKGERLSIESLPNYFLQYVGFRNTAGERIIWVNALCDIKNGMVEKNGEHILQPWPWTKELIIVDDGGDCYWNILLNIDKEEYSNFFVNGEE